MEIDSSRILDLVTNPREGLSVELKRWLDPDSSKDIAKIVRTVLAMRNFGGGYLVIGFDNNTALPDIEHAPDDARSLFHIDKIQGLITRFASEPFEILVEFPERDGQAYPVIVVPQGVRTPVASKSDLQGDAGKLISTDDVYTRTLRANNTPSTAKTSWKDWTTIFDVCFENREADLGRFFRRHLSGLKPESIREIATAMIHGAPEESSIEDVLRGLLRVGQDRFEHTLAERKLTLPEHGSWEVAMKILGDLPVHSANVEFLNLLSSSNPQYTGWPVWLNSRGFSDAGHRPYVFQGAWESFLVSLGQGWNGHIDFYRFDPKGNFYLRRALEDDISISQNVPQPLTALDFGLPVIRCAEAVAVGMAFAKAMGCDPEQTTLGFAFRWNHLKGRELQSWAQPGRYISPTRSAYQDEVTSFVIVPLDTPTSALGEFIAQIVQPLFEAFDGFALGSEVIEDFTKRLIERKL